MFVGHTNAMPGSDLCFFSILIAKSQLPGKHTIIKIEIFFIEQQVRFVGIKPVTIVNFKGYRKPVDTVYQIFIENSLALNYRFAGIANRREVCSGISPRILPLSLFIIGAPRAKIAISHGLQRLLGPESGFQHLWICIWIFFHRCPHIGKPLACPRKSFQIPAIHLLKRILHISDIRQHHVCSIFLELLVVTGSGKTEDQPEIAVLAGLNARAGIFKNDGAMNRYAHPLRRFHEDIRRWFSVQSHLFPDNAINDEMLVE